MAEVTATSEDLERKRMLETSLPFQALENPNWRKTEDVSVKEMLTQIMKYQREWEEKKDQYEPELVKTVYRKFLVHYISHVNKEEKSGFSTFKETDDFFSRFSSECSNSERRQFTIKERETIKFRDAYEHLLDKIKREERPGDYGLMEASLLQETHLILMKDIRLLQSSTKHGEFSTEPRKTSFKKRNTSIRSP